MHPLPPSLPVPGSHLQTYYSHLLCSPQFSPTMMMPPLCLRPALRQKSPSPEGLSIPLLLAALGNNLLFTFRYCVCFSLFSHSSQILYHFPPSLHKVSSSCAFFPRHSPGSSLRSGGWIGLAPVFSTLPSQSLKRTQLLLNPF